MRPRPEHFAELTAADLLRGYAAREVSPVEVVAAAAERIAADDHGAFWALCLDRATAEARAAEAAWRRGEARPLEGVPFAAKDLFDTAGLVTTYGSPMFASHVPDADADAVRRLRDAGAVLMGKTATHEFAWGLDSINERMGTSRNPADPGRVTGGSSGGSAAALAARLVPLALGTDTGGSIRLPAAFCGVWGLKPTWGLVSLDGVWPLARSLDHAGPMARSAEDLALMLGVLTGEPVEVASAVEQLVVGLCPDLHGFALAEGVERALRDGAERMAARGIRVREVAMPQAGRVADVYRTIQLPESLDTHRRTGLYPSRRAEYGDDVGGRLDLATEVTFADYLAATEGRERLRAAFVRAFRAVDLVLTPVSPIPPPPFATARATLRDAVLPYTAPQDLTGLPACAVPAGRGSDGLPVGLQLTGPAGSEALVLAAASALAG